MEYRTDNNGDVVFVHSEKDQICMDLQAIAKACENLREPTKKAGILNKTQAIERLVKDIRRRMP